MYNCYFLILFVYIFRGYLYFKLKNLNHVSKNVFNYNQLSEG